MPVGVGGGQRHVGVRSEHPPRLVRRNVRVHTFRHRHSSASLSRTVSGCRHPFQWELIGQFELLVIRNIHRRRIDRRVPGIRRLLAAWNGFGVLCGDAAVLIGFAARRLRRTVPTAPNHCRHTYRN